MPSPNISYDLITMRRHFLSGITRPYSYRKQQLHILRQAIKTHEPEIHAALRTDLNKSPEEAYGTETGLVLAELNDTLKNLKKWMRPRRVRTNLANLPSSSKVYRDPLGVVLIIAPWNYPFQLALIPLLAAIAGGNCAVVKPSELAPATAAVIEKILKTNFPAAYIHVAQGDGQTTIPAMIGSFRFDHIFFTGSIPVGRSIYQLAAEQLIPVTLELGGKSPAVVERDADIPTAARRIAFAKFTNAGQTCIAPDYLLLHADIKEEFLNALQQTLLKFYGERAEDSPDYGRIINEKRFDKLISYLTQGRIVVGGRQDRSKLFLSPTILEEVSPDQPVMTEEIFGPRIAGIHLPDDGRGAGHHFPQSRSPRFLYLHRQQEDRERLDPTTIFRRRLYKQRSLAFRQLSPALRRYRRQRHRRLSRKIQLRHLHPCQSSHEDPDLDRSFTQIPSL